MRATRSGRGHGSLGTVSVIVAIFIVLIVVSEASADVLEHGLLNYYLLGRNGPLDGAVIECPYNTEGAYFSINENAPVSGHPCPLPAAVGNTTYTNDIPGVELYPLYNAGYNLALQSVPSNASLSVNMYGLGYSQTLDSALSSALVSGTLPKSNTTYQMVITDAVANAYGLKVQDSLEITGTNFDFPGSGFNTTVLAKEVTISGILSASTLNTELNLAGIPVFIGDGVVDPIEAYLGYRPQPGQCGVSQPLPDSCSVGPEMLAIVSNNLFSDFFSHTVAGPDEVVFRLQPEPSNPNSLLNTLNEIQIEYSSLPGYGEEAITPTQNYTVSTDVYMVWRSSYGLLWEALGAEHPYVGSVTSISNLSLVANTQPPADAAQFPYVGIEQSQVTNRIESAADSSYILELDAVVLGIIIEVAALSIFRKRLLTEIEVYKANGLSRFGALWLVVSEQKTAIICIGSALVLSGATALVINAGVLLPVVLGGGFLGLMVVELTMLVQSAYRYRGFRHLARGKTG